MSGCRQILTLASGASLPAPSAYWKLDEAGGDRVDSMGVSNLTHQGGVDAGNVAGVVSNAISASPPNWRFVGVPVADLAYEGGNGITIAFWFKWLDNPGDWGASYELFAYYNDNAFFKFKVYPTKVNLSLDVYFDGGDTEETIDVDNAFAFVANTWCFIVGRYDSVSKKISLQLNDAAAVESASTLDTAGCDPNAQGYMECDSINDCPYSFDEMGMWIATKLSDAQVAMLYNSGSGKTYPFQP